MTVKTRKTFCLAAESSFPAYLNIGIDREGQVSYQLDLSMVVAGDAGLVDLTEIDLSSEKVLIKVEDKDESLFGGLFFFSRSNIQGRIRELKRDPTIQY